MAYRAIMALLLIASSVAAGVMLGATMPGLIFVWAHYPTTIGIVAAVVGLTITRTAIGIVRG
jgi:hypothetical protein